MKKIYLAIPYSKVDKEESFRISNKITAQLYSEGFAVFAPITQGHALAQENNLPTNWEFWQELDTEFILWSDFVYVVTMDGWQESTGVLAEIELAKLNNKGIKYITIDGILL